VCVLVGGGLRSVSKARLHGDPCSGGGPFASVLDGVRERSASTASAT